MATTITKFPEVSLKSLRVLRVTGGFNEEQDQPGEAGGIITATASLYAFVDEDNDYIDGQHDLTLEFHFRLEGKDKELDEEDAPSFELNLVSEAVYAIQDDSVVEKDNIKVFAELLSHTSQAFCTRIAEATLADMGLYIPLPISMKVDTNMGTGRNTAKPSIIQQD